MSKLLKVWETRQAQHAARAGGLGLLAVSLAACGSSDDTPYSQAEVDALQDEIDELTTERDDLQQAIDDATAAIEAAGADDLDDLIAQRDALQDDVDELNGEIAALQADYDELLEDLEPFSTALLTVNDDLVITLDGDDALTATHLTLLEGDVVIDVSDTDDDTLTISATGGISHSAVVQGYENITINNTSNIALTHALDGIADGTVTINNSLSASATDATVTGAGDITVVAGTGVTGTLTVDMVTGAGTVVNTGTASTVVITTGAATVAELAAQSITVVAGGDINLTAQDANTLTISGTGNVVLNAASAELGAAGTISGSATQELDVAAIADIDGATVTGFSSVIVAGTGDLTGVTTAINLDGVSTVQLSDSANVTLSSAAAVTLDYEDGDATTSLTGSLSVALAADVTGVAITINEALETDDFTVVNVTANVAQTGLDIDAGATVTINLAGAVDVVLATTTGLELNASTMTGGLTAAASADLLSITAGAGNDVIAAFAGATLIGGAGTDTLVSAVNMATVEFSGFEIIEFADNDAFLSGQLNGLAATALDPGAGADNINITGANSVNTTTIDLSGIVFANADDGVDMTGAQQNTGVILANASMTITGSNGADLLLGFDGADVISGGLGDDTITGGAGADNLTGGAGADTFNFVDSNGIDTITDFTTTADNLSFDGMTGITAVVGTAVAANAAAANVADAAVYVFADGADGTGAEVIVDYTDLEDVGAFLAAAFGDEAANDEFIAVINDTVGGQSYAYYVDFDLGNGGVGAIDEDAITLLAVITEAGGGILVAGDIA